MVKKQEFNGKSLSDALQEAANAFQTDVGAIAYSVVEEEKTNSFFSRLFTKGITIEAWVEDAGNIEEAARAAAMEAIEDHYEESRPPQQVNKSKKNSRFAKQAPVEEEAQAASEQQEGFEGQETEADEEEVQRNFTPLDAPEVEEIINNLTKLILKGMNIEESAFEITPLEDNHRIVQVDDEFLEQWLTRSDRLSECFEHLFRRILQKSGIEVSGRLFLNARNARELRTEKLKGLAFHLAEKVKNTGRTVGISSKTSQERRIIHLALDGTPGIGTRSIGTGDNRKLIIFNTERSRQRYNNRGGNSGGRGNYNNRNNNGSYNNRRHNHNQNGGRYNNRNQPPQGDEGNQQAAGGDSFFNNNQADGNTQEPGQQEEANGNQQQSHQGGGRRGFRHNNNRRPPFGGGRGGRGGNYQGGGRGGNYQGGGRKGAFSGGRRDQNNNTNANNSNGEPNAARPFGADGEAKQDRRSRRNPHRQRNSSEVEQSES